MPIKAYLAIVLLAAAFVGGYMVRGWRDTAATVATIQAGVKTATQANTVTQTRDISAATHVQAIDARAQALGQRDRTAQFHSSSPKPGDHHAAPSAATCLPPIGPDFLADPQFRVLYDAGASPDTESQADHVPTSGP